MKKERPILMSTSVVRSTLALLKTMTRRTVGLKEINILPDDWVVDGKPYHSYPEFGDDFNTYVDFVSKDGSSAKVLKCPYGQVGDILWVRETFLSGHKTGDDDCFALDQDGNCIPHTWFKASDPDLRWFDGTSDFPEENIPWKPSIHMPKAVARIWLEVTDIRVERVQDISDTDVFAEGVQLGEFPDDIPLTAFCSLWISINGLESWEANPWVWVVSFKVLSTTGKPDTL